MLRQENKSVLKRKRLRVLRSILLQPQVYHMQTRDYSRVILIEEYIVQPKISS